MVNYNIYETYDILYKNYNFDNVYKTAFANIFYSKVQQLESGYQSSQI